MQERSGIGRSNHLGNDSGKRQFTALYGLVIKDRGVDAGANLSFGTEWS